MEPRHVWRSDRPHADAGRRRSTAAVGHRAARAVTFGRISTRRRRIEKIADANAGRRRRPCRTCRSDLEDVPSPDLQITRAPGRGIVKPDDRDQAEPAAPRGYHSRAMIKRLPLRLALALLLVPDPLLNAQQDRLVPAPDRRSGEGRGPFPTLTIANVIVIDGTGAPPAGPMNVVIERNRIARISGAGTPGVPPRPGAPAPAGEVIDGSGMYFDAGFVNLHAHLGDNRKAPDAEYVYKLYMAHGVTTIRGVELAPQAIRAEGKGTQRRQRHRRAADLQLSAPGRRVEGRGCRHAGEGACVGTVVCRQRRRRHEAGRVSAADHGRAPGRGKEARARIDRAPRAAWGCPDECAHGGTTGPRDGHALLRALRSAAARLQGAAVARQHELQRRAAAVRPGRAAVGSDLPARAVPSGRSICRTTSSSAPSSIQP